MGQSALRTTDFRPEARHNTDLETRRDPDHPLLNANFYRTVRKRSQDGLLLYLRQSLYLSDLWSKEKAAGGGAGRSGVLEEQKLEGAALQAGAHGGERCASRGTVLESTVILVSTRARVDRPSVQLVPVRRYLPFAFAPYSLALSNRIGRNVGGVSLNARARPGLVDGASHNRTAASILQIASSY